MALTACAAPVPEPVFYNIIGEGGVELDKQEASKIINSYRQSRGLGTLTLDAQLNLAAKKHSEDMARNNKLSHKVTEGGFAVRIKKAGISSRVAAENVGAGYRTMAQAFSGWRGSASHNKNMLLDGASRMGIAAVYAPQSKYKVFWTLVVAGPSAR